MDKLHTVTEEVIEEDSFGRKVVRFHQGAVIPHYTAVRLGLVKDEDEDEDEDEKPKPAPKKKDS